MRILDLLLIRTYGGFIAMHKIYNHLKEVLDTVRA